MKKIFLFAAAVVAAMTVNAEQILFTAVAAAGTLNGKSVSDGELVLAITDEAEKIAVDSNSCWFGDAVNQVKFSLRLKTGGKSQVKEEATNALKLTVPRDGKLYVYARTGKNSAEDRNISLVQNEVTLLDHTLLESEAIKVKGLDSKEPEKETAVYPVLSCDVQEGDIDILYPVGAINIYGISFDAPIEPEPQGIEDVKNAVKAVKTFENGQLVIIKNGVKYNALGAQL